MAKQRTEDAPPAALWKDTFSDLMNLLLCFFVLLFAMSTVDSQKFEEIAASLSSSFSVLPQGGSALSKEGILVSSGASQLNDLSTFYNNMGLNNDGNMSQDIQNAYDEQGLREQGCDYVPLPITREEGIANQWHVTRSAEMDSSTGLSITVSCNDIDGALQFVSDLLEPEIIKLRFWGKEGDDYCVDENGLFYLTEEQEKRWMTSEEKRKHFCFYSYFPRVEGRLSDGINAFSLEYQTTEFFKNQPEDIQECFSAYGVTNYVDMIGNNESPGAWYPMYSYTTSLSSNSPAGQIRDQMEAVKHKWLPQVIMAEDFETAWEQYMEAYDSCNPEIYYRMLQLEVEKRVKG